MEIIINNIDIILIAAVIVIAAVVFARRGQIDLLRELIVSLSDTPCTDELYTRLPKITKMLISGKTVEKIITEEKSKIE